MSLRTKATALVLVLVVVSMGVASGDGGGGDFFAEERPDGLDKRAGEVYGGGYKNISSWSCYELCVSTATTEEQQIRDIIHTLSRHEGYVSEGEIVTNAPAASLDELPMGTLVESGVVEKRTADDWPNIPHFKYTGGQEPPSNVTDSQVRKRVLRRLYLSSTSMKAKEIARNLPVGVDRVKTALRTLESDERVDSGYDPSKFSGSREWIDTRHGTLPDSRFHLIGTTGLWVLSAVGVFGYGFFRRRQNPASESKSHS